MVLATRWRRRSHRNPAVRAADRAANEPDPTPSARPRIPDTPTRPIASVPRPQRCRSLPSASRLRAQPHGPPARFRPKTTAGGPWPPTRRSSRWRRRRTRSTRLARQHADLHPQRRQPSPRRHPEWRSTCTPVASTSRAGVWDRKFRSASTIIPDPSAVSRSFARVCSPTVYGTKLARSAPRSPTPLRPASGPGETLDRSPIGRAREVLAVLGRVRDIAGGTVHRRHRSPQQNTRGAGSAAEPSPEPPARPPTGPATASNSMCSGEPQLGPRPGQAGDVDGRHRRPCPASTPPAGSSCPSSSCQPRRR